MLGRRRNLAAGWQVDAQRRSVSARALAHGRAAAVTVIRGRPVAVVWLSIRRVPVRHLSVRRRFVHAIHAQHGSGVRQAARQELPQQQHNREADTNALVRHARILSPDMRNGHRYKYGVIRGN
jgi:hypothetical protein